MTGCSITARDITAPYWTGSDLKDMPINQPIETTFSENISSVDIVNSSVTAVEDGKTIVRKGTFSWKGKKVSFKSDQVFNYGTTYKVSLVNVTDSRGNILKNTLFSYTTVSNTPSTINPTPVADYDVGSRNSIVLSPDGRTYITYYNETEKSLYVVSTTDAITFAGPYKIDGPSTATPGNVGEYSSLAVDDAGKLHIAYYHQGVGLKYATTVDIVAGWSIETVDNGTDIGKYASLTVDSGNNVHISYYDEPNKSLKWATNENGAWATTVIDSGSSDENPGLYSSIKVDSNGVVHISYYNAGPKDIGLRYVNSTDWLSPTALDTSNNGGEFSALQLDSKGNVYIFYNYEAAGIRWIKCITNASGGWKNPIYITNVSGPTSNAIVADLNGGVWYLSYYSGGKLYYRSGLPLDLATNSWDWSPARLIDDTSGDGIYTSIAVGSNGKARIAYYDSIMKDLELAY